MKKQIWVAALLSLMLLLGAALSGCSSGPVVAKMDGDSVTTKDLKLYANYYLLQYGYSLDQIEDPQELKDVYDQALDYAIMFKMAMKKAVEQKLYPLSDDDRKEIEDTVNSYLDSELQSLVDSYTQQSAGDPDKAARKELNDRMQKTGLTRDNLLYLMRFSKVTELVMDGVMKDVAVTDTELQAGYETKLAQQIQDFTADASQYEEVKAQEEESGYPVVLYKPAGYRYVKHILVMLSDDAQTKISDAQMNGDEEGAKKIRDEELLKIKPKADEVLAKVQAGGDFDALMAEYGEDPGMKEEPASKTGYEIGSATMNFIEEFKQAAMGLAKVGDVTGLVATDYGYHIIKWVSDAPSVTKTLDEVKDALRQEMLEEEQNNAWTAFIDQLKAEYHVQEFRDLFPTLPPAPAGTATEAPAAG